MDWTAYLVSLVVTGLVVGALGRLVIPGPNPMSILATVGVGVLGALVGGLIAGLLGLGWLLTILLEIALAALLVWLVSRRTGAATASRGSS
jgi:uncharacterized membrane protein YeaQ/YmgE (transglycosylase-associated protein family)